MMLKCFYSFSVTVQNDILQQFIQISHCSNVHCYAVFPRISRFTALNKVEYFLMSFRYMLTYGRWKTILQ